MRRRQPLPRLWLMTDERQGEGLWLALEKLPRGSGIVFRHYSLPAGERRALFERIKPVARQKRLMLLLAGSADEARAWGADGSHGRGSRRSLGLRSAPVHDLAEIRRAERSGADILFLSPVFATRSHPGAAALGRVRFGLLAKKTRLPIIALGGMNAERAHSLSRFGLYGWAAIDAWQE